MPRRRRPCQGLREAALILLYRLMFILYAEDRDLLPVRDTRYDDYALRDRVRGDIGRRKDQGDTFAETLTTYWSAVDDLCRAIDQGEVSIGLPPYNGGLFDRVRVPLLDRIRLGDRVMADVIDALSFEQDEAGRRRYINYRNLGVRQLGSIYERLLEHELIREGDAVAGRPNIFARKGSGSYYTPDDLVALIVEETIGPLVQARMETFIAEAGLVPAEGPAREKAVARLAAHDPAEAILAFKVCDPAMGSGHFLVSLVDYLADSVIAAMAEAEAAVEGYVSPLASRIQAIRKRIVANAEERNWIIDRDRLDDRHIVRRMVLKRCVYGVDKNPMAVEARQGGALAAHLHGGRAAQLPGPPPPLRRQPVRRLGAERDRQGDRVWQPAAPARLRQRGGAVGAIDADDRRPDGRGDRRGAPLRRSLRRGGGGHGAPECRPLPGARPRLAGGEEPRGKDGAAILLRRPARRSHRGRAGQGRGLDGAAGERTPRRAVREDRRLIAEERFLNWQPAFPGVWTNWQSVQPEGGLTLSSATRPGTG